MKNREGVIILILIFIIFFFFRVYNLEKTVIFDWDQERDAGVIKKILTERRLTLIGPRVLGPEGFFLGPFFTYLLAPFYILTRLHPRAIIYFILVYNLGFFPLAFAVIKRLFNYPVALTFMLIWSLHPSLIGIDRIAWNPLLVPLMVMASWALFFLAFKKPSFFLWFWAGLCIGLGINFHFQLVFLFPFGLVLLLSQKKDMRKRLAAFFGGIVLCFIPVLVFDLRHNFLNFKLLLSFLGGKEGAVDYLAWLPVWRNVINDFAGFNFELAPIGFYLLVLGLAFWTWYKEDRPDSKLFFQSFLLLWILFPLGFTALGRRPSEYYFNFLYPFLILLFTYCLLKVAKNWLLIFLLVLLFFFKIDQLRTGLRPNPLGLFYKDKVIQRIAEIGQEKKFNVSFSVPLGLDTGYRYLLEFYQVEQSQNPEDPLFQVVIPPRPGTEVIGGIGLQIPKSFQQ